MTVEFDSRINEGSKVIVPISMGSDLKGEKLKELIEALTNNKCDVTILVADTLQQYNTDYDTALKMGDAFLEENNSILKNVKILRWHDYIASKKDEFDAKREIIEATSKKGSVFYNKMITTQQKCVVSKDIEKSLLYQKEEYAIYLTLSNFDYHIYPKAISDGMAWLYKEFPQVTKPQYVHAKFNKVQAKKLKNISFFEKDSNKRHEASLPLALRLLLGNLEVTLETEEISQNTKQVFMDKISNMIILKEAQFNKNTEKNSSTSVLVKH